MKFHQKENAQSKSYSFAIKIIELCRKIKLEEKEYIISNQVLRSGTSIGANLQEAQGMQSNKDLLHKISISYKEARETKYWVSLLYDTKYIGHKDKEEILSDLEELLKILGASIVTLRKKLNNA